MTSSIDPILSWPGGKRQLISKIAPLIPTQYNTYIEPFVGAGAILLNELPKKAIINDLSPELIRVYNVIKESPEELISYVAELNNKNSEEQYYEVRAWDRDPNYEAYPEIKKAARTLYLNKTCFNGLYRVNSKGYFNASYNKRKKPPFLDSDAIRELSKYLNNNDIEILNGDYKVALSRAQSGDFVYVDPPYDYEPGVNGFVSYTSTLFMRDEQEELFKQLVELDQQGVKWLFSNNATKWIMDLYSNFDINFAEANRTINPAALAKTGPAKEVLIKNY